MVDETPGQAEKPELPVKTRKPGAKLEESPYRDSVATMLLIGQSYAYIQRFLEKSKFKVKFETLKEFEANYVVTLSKEVQDSMIQKAVEEKRKTDEKIVQNATYANMSKVDTLIQLLGEAEAQVETIRTETASTWMSRQEMGAWMDRIYRLRKELEESRLSSEVQIERSKAIESVVSLSLKLLKDSKNIEEFIKQSDVIRTGHKSN